MTRHMPTVAERIRLDYDRLTRSEKQLADTLLGNYPVAGLTSITEFAKQAGVSSPTVIRTVQKLGFSGFPAFQEALRAELSAQFSTPLTKYDQWGIGAPETHILTRFAAAVHDNIQQSLKLVDHREFDRLADLLADRKRATHVIGGRLTRSIADYLFTHLHALRPGVFALPGSASLWPQHVLDMRKGDVLVTFDVRRYERNLGELAQAAHRKGLIVVLFTDRWISPISSIARHTLPLRIEVPSRWDSAVVTLFLVEALIAAVIERLWPQAEGRIQELESLFDATNRFRK